MSPPWLWWYSMCVLVPMVPMFSLVSFWIEKRGQLASLMIDRGITPHRWESNRMRWRRLFTYAFLTMGRMESEPEIADFVANSIGIRAQEVKVYPMRDRGRITIRVPLRVSFESLERSRTTLQNHIPSAVDLVMVRNAGDAS